MSPNDSVKFTKINTFLQPHLNLKYT